MLRAVSVALVWSKDPALVSQLMPSNDTWTCPDWVEAVMVQFENGEVVRFEPKRWPKE